MNGLIIGICGFIGSGKGSVGDILCSEYDFVQESFAKPLKDAVAAIFGWNRKLLEGDTKKSREFREKEDEYWTNKLGYSVTPRLILQKFGAEVVRNSLSQSIWLDALEKRLKPKQQYVITDVRFKNEIALIKSLGGYVIKVNRKPLPEWFTNYKTYASMHTPDIYMNFFYPEIHKSEWDWIDCKFDYEIDNNGTLEDLGNNVMTLLEYCYLDQLIKE